MCCTLWVTATPCQLHCRPRGRLFSVMLRDMVVDGTPCRPGRRDVCIGGRCRVSLLHAPLPHRFTETSFFWNSNTHYLFNRLKFKLIFISPPGLRETQSKVGLCFATVSFSSFLAYPTSKPKVVCIFCRCFLKDFCDVCQTNYLNIYWTDFHEICSVSETWL